MRLIANADDYGAAQEINQDIETLIDAGTVGSVTVLVYGRANQEAFRFLREHPAVDVGLHFDMTWGTEDLSKCKPFKNVAELWRYVLSDPASAFTKIESEVQRQADLLRERIGRDISHIDSHQHIHLLDTIAEPFFSGVRKAGVQWSRAFKHRHPLLSRYVKRNNVGSVFRAIEMNGIRYLPTLWGIADYQKKSAMVGLYEVMLHPRHQQTAAKGWRKEPAWTYKEWEFLAQPGCWQRNQLVTFSELSKELAR